MKAEASMFSLAGQVALVTGASRGLGLAMARGLAQAGATVYINSRNHDALKEVAAAASEEGMTLLPLAFDVEDESGVNAAFDKLRVSGLDILINNVGVRDRRGMFDLDAVAFNALLNNHVTATFSMVRCAAPLMRKRGAGRVINMLSVVAFRASANDTAYVTAKGALASLTRAQAVELGKWNITVNAIAPGAFATATNRAIAGSDQGQLMVNSRTCLQRWGKEDEITGAAVFLASPAASYITGHTLAVDGGVLAQY